MGFASFVFTASCVCMCARARYDPAVFEIINSNHLKSPQSAITPSFLVISNTPTTSYCIRMLV